MKVYNKDKTKILEKYNLKKGYLVDDILVTHILAVEGRKEEGHYETISEYPNGGKDVKWIVDIEAIEAIEEHDKTEKIQVYVPYTQEEIKAKQKEKEIENKNNKINEYKNLLSSTDYKVIKYVEGYYTDKEYNEIKKIRERYREKIRQLERNIKDLEDT